MIESVSSGAAIQFQPGNFAREESGGASKVKLDLDSVPESKVKVVAPAAGEGKGLLLDVRA